MKKYFRKKNFKAFVPSLMLHIFIVLILAFILYFINFTTIYAPYTNIENIQQLYDIGSSPNPLNKYVKIKSELLTLTDIAVPNKKTDSYDKYIYSYQLDGNTVPVIVNEADVIPSNIENHVIIGKVQAKSNNNLIFGEQYYEYIINERSNDRIYYQVAVGIIFLPILISLFSIVKYSKYFIKKKNPMYKYLLSYTPAKEIPDIVDTEIINKTIYSVDNEIIITDKLIILDCKSPSIVYLDDVICCALTDKGYKNPYGSIIHFYLRDGHFVKSAPINNNVSIHAKQLLSQKCPWIIIDTKKKISKLVKKDFTGLLHQVDSFKKELKINSTPVESVVEPSDLVFKESQNLDLNFEKPEIKTENDVLVESIDKLEHDVHENLIIDLDDVPADDIDDGSANDSAYDSADDLDDHSDIKL